MQFKYFLYTIALVFSAFAHATAQNWDTKIVKLGYITSMVYNAQTDRFFVALEDKVLVINPYLGTITDSLVVGGSITNSSEILKFAVSDDAQYLYLIKRSETKIRRYKLATKAFDLDINIGTRVSDIEVMPGRPQTIAVARFDALSMAIYDNAIKRPNTVGSFYSLVSNITFGYKDSTTIYGSKDGSSSNQLSVIKVTSSGATLQRLGYDLITDFQGRFSVSQDGFMYTNRGFKINLKNYDVLFKDGIYGDKTSSYLPNYVSNYYFAADPTQNKVYSLLDAQNGGGTRLVVFNKTTFNFDTVYTLPVSFPLGTYQTELFEWGTAKLAMVSGGNLVLMRQCTPQNPTPPTILEGRNKIGCTGESVNLTASGNANRYIWSTGDTGKVIKIAFNSAFYTQSAAVAMLDTEGCLSPYSLPTTVSFESPPSMPSFYVADQKTATCTGDSINLIANIDNRFTAYWSNGSIGNSIWVKQTGDYNFYATTINGCKSTNSESKRITIYSFTIPPRPTVTITSGDTVLCEGASITLSATAGFPLYKWSNGDNERTTTIVPASSQSISVRVSDANGCQSAPSVAIYLERIFKPSTKPVITLRDNVLASTLSTGNQWFRNDVLIVGATNQFYTPTQTGTYTAKRVERGCFSDPSNAVQF